MNIPSLPFEGDAFDQIVGLTNDVLTENETRHVKNRFIARRNRIFQIDKILYGEPKPGRPELHEDRRKMLLALRRYQVALAPHKKLPIEIWQDIFHYVCLSYTGSTPKAKDPPLLLCQICSNWRQIVLNMQELWSEVHFSVKNTVPRRKKLQIAQLWFSRTSNRPLSLTLLDTPDDQSPFLDFVAHLIAPYSSRFKFLNVQLHPAQIDALLSLPTGSLDGVEKFCIVANTRFCPGDIMSLKAREAPVTIFSQAAQLRSLKLLLTPLIIPRAFHFPWQRLEFFKCDSSLDAHECIEMLVHCHSLKKLYIRVFGIKYYPRPTIQISLPYLESLTIQICDPESYDPFFHPLILPRLKSLWMLNSYSSTPWTPNTYDDLIQRSGCSLEHLSLPAVVIERPHDLRRLFQLTPDLISITLSANTHITPEILAMIGRAEIGARLAQIFLKGGRALDPLLTMFELRLDLLMQHNIDPHGPHPLAALKFFETFCDFEEIRSQQRRITRLRNYGFEISLLASED